METVRQSYFLQLYISHETPQLYVGPTGTGKSAITNSFLIQLPKERSVYIPSTPLSVIECIGVSVQAGANCNSEVCLDHG